VTVDVTDMLQTSKHNFQFRAKHQKYVKPCHREEKYLSNDKKISVLFAIVILMSALFLLRYYGSCYRLQHVEKAKNKTQKRTCQRRANMTKWKKRNMPKKQRNEKEDRRKGREEKGPKLHATTW